MMALMLAQRYGGVRLSMMFQIMQQPYPRAVAMSVPHPLRYLGNVGLRRLSGFRGWGPPNTVDRANDGGIATTVVPIWINRLGPALAIAATLCPKSQPEVCHA